jgi:hypothetical protein
MLVHPQKQPRSVIFIAAACLLAGVFAGGMVTAFHLYEPGPDSRLNGGVYAGRFVPLPPPDQNRLVERADALPTVDVIDVERMRKLAGRRARVRGKIYRVGHSVKSGTFFLDFGPSRSSFTAVIFASARDAFERKKIAPAQFEGSEVELVGTIEDDPRYGLEMILEDPAQIQRLD